MNNQPITRPQAILNLQRYLRQLSYFDEALPPPPLSGTWDARTEESLVAFQKKYRLPQTGRADDVTWNLLYDEYKRSMEKAALPRSLPLFPLVPDGYEIGIGEEIHGGSHKKIDDHIVIVAQAQVIADGGAGGYHIVGIDTPDGDLAQIVFILDAK